MTQRNTELVIDDLVGESCGRTALGYPWPEVAKRMGEAEPGHLVVLPGDTVRAARVVLRSIAVNAVHDPHPGPLLYFCCGASPVSVVEALVCHCAQVDRAVFRRCGPRSLRMWPSRFDSLAEKLQVAGSMHSDLGELQEAVECVEPRAVFLDTAVAPAGMGTNHEPNSYVTWLRELADTWSVPVVVASDSGRSPWAEALSAQADSIIVASECDGWKRTGRIKLRIERSGGKAVVNGTTGVVLDPRGVDPEEEARLRRAFDGYGPDGRRRPDVSKASP